MSKTLEPGAAGEVQAMGCMGAHPMDACGKGEKGFFTGMIQKVQGALDAVQDALDPFDAFTQRLEQCVVKTLTWVSPQASEKVKGQMIKAVPQLENVDMVIDKTESTIHASIMEQKDRLLDLCQDLIENLASGWKPIKALKDCFRRVGTFLLRMVKKAINAGVMVLMALAGVFGCCCAMLVNVATIVESVFSKIQKMVKQHLKKLLKKKAPDWIVEKLPWNWTHETNIGDAVSKVEEKKAAGEQTQKAKKGLPERDPKAEKEAKKVPKGVTQRAKAAGSAGRVTDAAAAALLAADSIAVVEEGMDLVTTDDDDDHSDEEWDDDDGEDDSDAYSDFDNEDGEKK